MKRIKKFFNGLLEQQRQMHNAGHSLHYERSVFLMSLLQLLECPVCLKRPERGQKALACNGGHFLCESCFCRLPIRRCPLCRRPFEATPPRNLHVENQVNLIHEYFVAGRPLLEAEIARLTMLLAELQNVQFGDEERQTLAGLISIIRNALEEKRQIIRQLDA